MQPPPVAGGVGGRREAATGHVAEPGPRPDQGEHHEEGEHHGDRVGEEPGREAGVDVLLLVVEGSLPPGGHRRGVALGGRGPAPLGHVGRLVGGGGRQVADEVEAVPVGHPPRRQQPAYGVGLGGLQAAALPPGGDDLAGAGVQRHERGEVVERLTDGPDQQEPDHPQHGAERQPDRLQGQRPRAGVDQQRVERRPALLVVGVPSGQRGTADPAVGRLRVEHDRRGHHHRGVTRRRRAPAEVDVVAEDRELVVEAAQLLEHPSADQHPGGVDRENGAHLVVLALVVLAALQAGLPTAGPGDRDAELQQPAQRGPLAQLGAEDVDLRVLVRDGEQRGQRARLGVGVVVQQPDPLTVGGSGPEAFEADLDGARVAGGPRDPLDVAEGLLEQVGALVLATGVDRHPLDKRGGLRPDALDHRG